MLGAHSVTVPLGNHTINKKFMLMSIILSSVNSRLMSLS